MGDIIHFPITNNNMIFLCLLLMLNRDTLVSDIPNPMINKAVNGYEFLIIIHISRKNCGIDSILRTITQNMLILNPQNMPTIIGFVIQ